MDVRRESECVPEETASVSSQSGTLASDGEVLAGESSANKVNSSHESEAVSPLIGSPHVVMPRYVGPMRGEYLATVLVDLDLSNALVSSSLKPEVKASDAGKKAHESHRPDDAKLV